MRFSSPWKFQVTAAKMVNKNKHPSPSVTSGADMKPWKVNVNGPIFVDIAMHNDQRP